MYAHAHSRILSLTCWCAARCELAVRRALRLVLARDALVRATIARPLLGTLPLLEDAGQTSDDDRRLLVLQHGGGGRRGGDERGSCSGWGKGT